MVTLVHTVTVDPLTWWAGCLQERSGPSSFHLMSWHWKARLGTRMEWLSQEQEQPLSCDEAAAPDQSCSVLQQYGKTITFCENIGSYHQIHNLDDIRASFPAPHQWAVWSHMHVMQWREVNSFDLITCRREKPVKTHTSSNHHRLDLHNTSWCQLPGSAPCKGKLISSNNNESKHWKVSCQNVYLDAHCKTALSYYIFLFKTHYIGTSFTRHHRVLGQSGAAQHNSLHRYKGHSPSSGTGAGWDRTRVTRHHRVLGQGGPAQHNSLHRYKGHSSSSSTGAGPHSINHYIGTRVIRHHRVLGQGGAAQHNSLHRYKGHSPSSGTGAGRGRTRVTRHHRVLGQGGAAQHIVTPHIGLPSSSRLAIRTSRVCMDSLSWFSFWLISSIFIVTFSTLTYTRCQFNQIEAEPDKPAKDTSLTVSIMRCNSVQGG